MTEILDEGPFYHGTKADLQVGDVLRAGFSSNYDEKIIMNHVYFTALADGAGLAAELARGTNPARVYQIEPTGLFENDPNVTDKKFKGNPTRSYRSSAPLKIVAEIKDWKRPDPAVLKIWQEKLKRSDKGEILN
ncbi:NAD(+)--rifampin ADP-ribosyltransferase [Lactococcus kimchii]|uniref:NAD(+)--rifampin ADP-ribosyltransferase n=1 Tax=Lactococcus sp. S-13 TaxID=2507158 RepID=UPI001022D680|nr:NAD(+)--rifampin ADP-ribosyltransferase [Lactococcus sp. S-13]RZI48412.1 NAD(+)--rifampin ADP-ribosyltransferase [Lactococcus sp. S-13]